MLNVNQDKRLWFIELITWWEGRLTTSHLIDQFGISRRQAQLDIQRYTELQRQNLSYYASRKGYCPSSHFNPAFISGDVTEYLNWISQADATLASAPAHMTYTGLALPPRQVSAYIIRELVTAIRQQRRVDVDYVSLTNPDHQGRIIAPHHFVKTGLRWHLRAFCEKSQQYRDFVLSRFRGIPELMDKSQHGAAHDLGWNTHLQLRLKPDPRLSTAQQDVLAHDYQMQNGQLTVNTRACLTQYLLQEMQLQLDSNQRKPEAQQLVLINPEVIKPWLFDDKS